MTRDELIDLGKRILAEEGDDVLDGLMAEFDRNVLHPEGSSLFFYPEGWNARSSGPPLLATIPPGCCPKWQTKPN